MFCRVLLSPRPFLGQILCIRFLRSHVVWSGSTLGPAERLVCFIVSAHSSAFTVPVRLFPMTVSRSLWTGLHRSTGMYCVTLVVDNYLSYHFVYWLMNTHIFRRRQQFPLSICDFMVKFLYPLRSLSVVRFQIWKFLTGSEAISVSIFSLKKGWVGVTAGQALRVLMEYCVFHKIFLSLITSWTRDYTTPLVVLQHGTTISLRGQGSACPKSWPGV